MEKCRKLKICINPARSPLNLIRKKIEHSDLILDATGENQLEEITDIDQYLDRLSRKIQLITAEEKHDDKQYKLLKMMYSGDVDAESVLDNLGISMKELKSIVDDLVELGLLQFVSDDELEITEEGILYIENQDSKF